MARMSKELWLATGLLIVMSCTVWQLFSITLDKNIGPQRRIFYTHLSKQREQTEIQFTVDTLPPWDYTRLINLSDFKFHQINRVCDDRPLQVLILVHTAPKNVEKRRAIRESWGTPRKDMKLLFLLGAVEDQETQNKLDSEDSKFHDIIQGNFKDAYKNLTYKHIMAFKYTIYYCPKAKYILKVDDDLFVNTGTLVEFLEKLPLNNKNYIFCSIMDGSPAIRVPSKWRVPFEEFPHSTYPVYCSGFAIVYSYDTVFRLYREAQRGDYFWVDDAHVTGTLAKRINLTHTRLHDLYMNGKEMDKYINGTGNFINKPFLYGPINMGPNNVIKLWNVVQNRTKITNTTQNTTKKQ